VHVGSSEAQPASRRMMTAGAQQHQLPAYRPQPNRLCSLWQALLTMTGCMNASPPEVPGVNPTCFSGALQSGGRTGALPAGFASAGAWGGGSSGCTEHIPDTTLVCALRKHLPALPGRHPASAAQEHGLQHEVLSSRQAGARFPGYHLPPSFQTLYEPEGGYLVPEKCIAAHLQQAQQHGAQLLTGTKVLGWQASPAAGGEANPSNSSPSSGGSGGDSSSGGPAEGPLVEVSTSEGSFAARRLVLAGGGWMPQLVPQLAVSEHPLSGRW